MMTTAQGGGLRARVVRAMEHSIRHAMPREAHGLPWTSINADVLRDAVRLLADSAHADQAGAAESPSVPATVARLLSEIARPRPMVAIMDDLDGYQLAESESPHTGQRVYAMSRPLFERLERELLALRARYISNHAEVSSHRGRSLDVAILPPPGSRAAPHTLRLEPTPIEES